MLFLYTVASWRSLFAYVPPSAASSQMRLLATAAAAA
jgi:hypothetical protein